MQLDPELVPVVMAARAMKPIWQTDLSTLRRELYVPLPGVIPAVVRKTEDFTISSAYGGIPARLYEPETRLTSGLIVFFHGGGFVMGDLDSHDLVCRTLCSKAGTTLIAVDYRLAPENKFPAAVDDCMAATLWAQKSAASLGLDSGKVVVCGDSAGGNLAAVTALRIRNDCGVALRGQVLIYPVTGYYTPELPSYEQNSEGYILTKADMVNFWNQYLASPDDARNPYAVPLNALDFAGLCPALIITAEFDPLRDEGESFAGKLREAGVPVQVTRYTGAIHGFFRMSHISRLARDAMEEVTAWLYRTLEE